MTSKEKGFSLVEIVISLVIIGLVGLIVWLFINNQESDTVTAPTNNSGSTQVKPEYQPLIPDGWQAQTDKSTGITYATPKSWKTTLKIETFTTSDTIPVGYGAPVYVRYSTQDKAWQTFDNDSQNEPTILRETSLVKNSQQRIENKYIVGVYNSGDGEEAQSRLLTVKGDTVYQFSLPSTCGGVICTEGNTTTQRDIEASISQLIQTIKL